ncbi:hypothetical protein [Bosea sp. MMO-172]|uniref:hypothetical protein n=1 Tax=Bosea sp. MMO-172 TaxID=3127885 RepID=UPI0030180425
MTISRKEIDELARTVLGRRLSLAEIDDLARQCALVGLRAGEEAYLLGLVHQRDLVTRIEMIARKAAEAPSLAGALMRLRRWIAVMAVALAILGWTIYEAGHLRGYTLRDRMVAQDLAWTATTAGLGARRLYDSGIVPFLIDCSLPGWRQVERQCVPGIDPISKRMFSIPNRRPEDTE